MTRPYRGDPLRRIPSAAILRRRLEDTRETARRLTILLDTAERLESESDPEATNPTQRDKRKAKGDSI